MEKHQRDNNKSSTEEPGWLRIEKIDMEYKR